MNLQILQPIATAQHHHGDAQRGEVLLKLEAAVCRDQDGEPAVSGCAKENSVPQPEPSLFANGRSLDAGEFSREASRKRLVNEHSQR